MEINGGNDKIAPVDILGNSHWRNGKWQIQNGIYLKDVYFLCHALLVILGIWGTFGYLTKRELCSHAIVGDLFEQYQSLLACYLGIWSTHGFFLIKIILFAYDCSENGLLIW